MRVDSGTSFFILRNLNRYSLPIFEVIELRLCLFFWAIDEVMRSEGWKDENQVKLLSLFFLVSLLCSSPSGSHCSAPSPI